MTGIAVLCVAAQLFGLAHMVVVEHERCAEHGELVHGDGHAPGAVAAPIARVTTTAASRALPAWPDEADGDHEHCLSATERRDLRAARVEAPVLVRSAGLQAIHPAGTVAIARALYRTAPKTSPPQLA